jgi:uncharacterized protein (DUF1684 family)
MREMSSDLEPDELSLADWRRRIAELYADVRRLAAVDPAAALTLWRQVREALYREHDQSPVPAADRAAFRAFHFETDSTLRFEVPIVPETRHPDADVPLSTDGAMSFRRIGWLDVPFSAGERRLALYWLAGYAGGLFLPFRDATNGYETYAAGRYLLDGAKGADLGVAADGRLIVDFNFAYQPSCAFDPRWTCPLAPPENGLDLAIRAGERIA